MRFPADVLSPSMCYFSRPHHQPIIDEDQKRKTTVYKIIYSSLNYERYEAKNVFTHYELLLYTFQIDSDDSFSITLQLDTHAETNISRKANGTTIPRRKEKLSNKGLLFTYTST